MASGRPAMILAIGTVCAVVPWGLSQGIQTLGISSNVPGYIVLGLTMAVFVIGTLWVVTRERPDAQEPS